MLIAENPTPEIDELSQEISTSPAAATNEVSELTPEDPYPHISLHALSGLPSSETFCLYGELNHAHLTILIDSGSMHNFLQPRIAQFLHLPVKSTQPLRVLVRNGSILNCDQLRRNIRFFGNKKGFKNDDGVVIRANNLISEAISKLEDEFKRLLSSYRFVFNVVDF